MKLNDLFSIRVCIGEIRNNGMIGDIYDNMEVFKREHPNSSYRFVYCVVNENGVIPDNCNDWNDSPEEAIADYQCNCTIYMNGF